MSQVPKCGMAVDDKGTFVKSCKHRFLGDCWKRLPCPYKLKSGEE
jgi:hypothetical protein